MKHAVVILLAVWTSGVRARDPVPEIPQQDFERLHALIKPQPGESPWREIPWVTSIREARERAAREDRPIVIFTAADGSPLGRT